jgi:DNA-binding transcriptional regulator YiaG
MPTSSPITGVGRARPTRSRRPLLNRPGGAPLEKAEVYVTYTAVSAQSAALDLAELRRSLCLTQREAALLLAVALNTWARWERGELGVHPERARQLRRLGRLVAQYGEPAMCGLGVDGVREVLDGTSVPDALAARGLDKYGAPPRASLVEGRLA